MNRFLGRDRVKLENNLTNYFGINPYVFVNNNPVRNVDAEGNYTNPIKNPAIRGYQEDRFIPESNKYGMNAGTYPDGSAKPHTGNDLFAKIGTQSYQNQNCYLAPDLIMEWLIKRMT